jgi:chromosome segregation ATPase
MTDVIKLEAECLTELAKKLQAARDILKEALPKLKKARMSSGWFTDSREIINNDIDNIMREITSSGSDLQKLSSVLLQGAATYTTWENNLKGSESRLSSDLSKVWAFEAENFESGANADKKVQIATTSVPRKPGG